MAQHDYNIANQTGANFRSDLNNALSAIATNNSGATEPSTTFAYEWWIDTNTGVLKLRNSANNAWLTMPISISADNTVDINGGTVNGISSLSFNSGSTVTSILDEDDFSSDSATALATQQSIKAYVASQITLEDLDITDGSNSISIDLDSETLSLLGGTGVTSTASGNGVTFAIGQSVGTSDNVVFNQVTGALVGNASTANALATARTISGVSFDGTANITLDTDNIGEGSSNKYFTNERVDDQVNTLLTAGTNISLTYDDAAGTLTIANTNSADITSVVAGDGLTGGGTAGDVTLAVGVDDSSIEINSDALRVKATGITNAMLAGSIANAKLANSSITVNSQAIALGGSHTFDTDNIGEGSSNLYFTNERTDDRVAALIQNGTGISFTYNDSAGTLTPVITLSPFDTDNLSEGSSNLYYTDTRANSAIDARVTNTFINNLSGVVADTATALATGRTIALSGDVTASGVSFDGTGNITLSTTIAANSVALGTDTTGNYVSTISGTTNEIDVSGSGSETATVTIGLPDDVTISGNLTVNGTTTTVNSDTLSVTDPLIKLAKANSGADSLDIGFYGLYDTSGSQDLYAGLFRDANDSGKFKLFKDLQVEPTTTVNTSGTGYAVATLVSNLEGNVTGQVSTLSNHDTDNLSEGSSNLYFTNARSRSAISASGDISYDSTTGVISFTQSSAPVTSVNSATGAVVLDTDDIAEGSSNLYFTNARADTRINLQTGSNLDLSSKSTSDLSEGTNLYYTDTRFDTRLGTKTTDNLTEGSSNLYMTTERVQDIVGGMVTGNTETGITVTYDDSDGTLDFVVATLNQDTTGNAATATALETGRNFSITGDITASAISFDGTGNVALSADIDANTVGISELNVSDGSNGQVLTTDGAGNLSFSTASGTTINNNADNRVITGSGTANTLEGEANFIFDGKNVGINRASVTQHATDVNTLAIESDKNGKAGAIQLFSANDTVSSVIHQDTTGLSFITNSSVSGSRNDIVFQTASSEKMKITEAGLVGIGTSSPATKLHLGGTAPLDSIIRQDSTTSGTNWEIGEREAGKWQIFEDDGDSIVATFMSTGNVGIGTSSPASAFGFSKTLEIQGGANAEVNISQTDNSKDWSLGIGNGVNYQQTTSGQAYAWWSGGTERMRIDSSGRVGIGTTGGNAGLHVANADIRCTGSAIANDGNSISMSQESAGAFINARGAHTSSRGTLNLHVSASNGGLGITGLTVNSDGSVSKYSGSFKIDHPLESKKDTHNLVHSFVEAPQADNIYRGVAVLENGSATVNLDTVSGMTEGTFVALNTNTLCFTSNETDWDAVKGIVKGNILTINCQNTSSMATVSWLVIGERQDQHMIDANWTDENGKIIVEPQKESEFSFLKENKNDELEL